MTSLSILQPQNRKRPFQKITINGEEVSTLADTGSNITVLSLQDFRRVTHNKKPEQVGGPCTAGAASGSKINIIGIYLLPMTIQGRTTTFPVHVCSNWKGYGVLGVDIMKYLKIIIDTEDNSIYFKDRDLKQGVGQLTTRAAVTIPSGSSMKVTLSAKMSGERRFSPKTLGIVQMSTAIEQNPGLESEDALVYTDCHGNVATLIHNCSVEEMRIERGRNMGNFYTVHKSKEQRLTHMDDILDTLPFTEEPKKEPCSKETRQT